MTHHQIVGIRENLMKLLTDVYSGETNREW